MKLKVGLSTATIALALSGCSGSGVIIDKNHLQQNDEMILANNDLSDTPQVIINGVEKKEGGFVESEIPFDFQMDNKTTNEYDGIQADIPFNEDITFFFGFDKYKLTQKQKEKLQKHIDWLIAHPGNDIIIEGHTDQAGTSEYNIALGERRARAVMNYMNIMGVSAGQMDYVSYGEEMPISYGMSKEDYFLNRRAIIRYSTTK